MTAASNTQNVDNLTGESDEEVSRKLSGHRGLEAQKECGEQSDVQERRQFQKYCRARTGKPDEIDLR